jgi:hypothetical protein
MALSLLYLMWFIRAVARSLKTGVRILRLSRSVIQLILKRSMSHLLVKVEFWVDGFRPFNGNIKRAV